MDKGTIHSMSADRQARSFINQLPLSGRLVYKEDEGRPKSASAVSPLYNINRGISVFNACNDINFRENPNFYVLHKSQSCVSLWIMYVLKSRCPFFRERFIDIAETPYFFARTFSVIFVSGDMPSEKKYSCISPYSYGRFSFSHSSADGRIAFLHSQSSSYSVSR